MSEEITEEIIKELIEQGLQDELPAHLNGNSATEEIRQQAAELEARLEEVEFRNNRPANTTEDYKRISEIQARELESLRNQIKFLKDEPTYDEACDCILEGFTKLVGSFDLEAEDFEEDIALAALISYGLKRMAGMVKAMRNLCERLKQEAQIHAQEARTQKSTVHEIYQSLGINKGDWNGAKPVVEMFEALRARVAELESDYKRLELNWLEQTERANK